MWRVETKEERKLEILEDLFSFANGGEERKAQSVEAVDLEGIVLR